MRRIQRDTRHEDFIQELTKGEKPLFKEIWRLLLFAASIGVHNQKRTPLVNIETGKNIPENYFSSPGWPGFLYLIGVADSADSTCLKAGTAEHEGLVTQFEEYANHGLDLLRRRVDASPTPLDGCVALLLEVTDAPQGGAAVVEDLI